MHIKKYTSIRMITVDCTNSKNFFYSAELNSLVMLESSFFVFFLFLLLLLGAELVIHTSESQQDNDGQINICESIKLNNSIKNFKFIGETTYSNEINGIFTRKYLYQSRRR